MAGWGTLFPVPDSLEALEPLHLLLFFCLEVLITGWFASDYAWRATLSKSGSNMIVDVLILRSFVLLCSSFSPSFLCSPLISGLPVLEELTRLILQLFFFITEHFILLDELFILILNFLREILELFLSFFPLSLWWILSLSSSCSKKF